MGSMFSPKPPGQTVQGSQPASAVGSTITPAATQPTLLSEAIRKLQPQNLSETQQEALLYRLEQRALQRMGELRVGMYDGSFDPPHYGHVETAHAAIGIAGLDLVVINCHPKPNSFKPNLSPHDLRTKMLTSYFVGESNVIVSPLSRGEIEALLSPHRIVGIIGSDVFNRFVREGMAEDFRTDEIFVAERRSDLLYIAPVTFEGRPTRYLGAAQLAFNGDSSSSVRAALAAPLAEATHSMLNEETRRIIRENKVYDDRRDHSKSSGNSQHEHLLDPRYPLPRRYEGCSVVRRLGLQNGLLSESYIFEVRAPGGDIVAFMKMLPPERDPHTKLPDEAAGLSLVNQLGIPGVFSPDAELCGDPPSLWVERAPGETLGSFITRYDAGEVSLEELCVIFGRVGAFLRELHTRCPISYNAKAARLLEAYIRHHELYLAEANPHELHASEVAQAIVDFRESSEALRRTGLRCSLLHGDPNGGNFLWDRSTEKLGVIDLQRLGTQIRTSSIGFSTYEYQYFLHALHYYPNTGFKGMRGGIEAALIAYREGYGEVDPTEERFFRSLWVIRMALAGHTRVDPIRVGRSRAR